MDKNIFERRERNFWNLMRENAEIETLTEEQHDALSDLANLRHQLHTNRDLLFNDEAPNDNLWKSYDHINEKLTACNLTKIDLPDANIPLADRWLKIAGCKTIFHVNSLEGTGVIDILDYLSEDVKKINVNQ